MCSVYLSNGSTSGSRAIDDLIKKSRLFFAPLGRGLFNVSTALCSLLFLFPHLCHLLLPCHLLYLSHPFFSALLNLSLSAKAWDGSLILQKWLQLTIHFVCILHRTPASLWSKLRLDSDGEDGWRGELHAVKSEGGTANTEKRDG